MSDTPETDSELRRIADTYKGTPVDAVLTRFARRLERERDEARHLAKLFYGFAYMTHPPTWLVER